MSIMASLSCTKHKDVSPEIPGSIDIKIAGSFGNQELSLGKYYALNGQDSIKISNFRFYISNIKIKNSITGQWYNIPDSYFLFDQANAHTDLNTLTFDNIPAGRYSELAFYTGIDSIANTNETIANSIPALSPSNNMFWVWNTGYVFYKLEGKYKNINHTGDKGSFVYHVGSNANLSKQQYLLPGNMTIGNGTEGNISIKADAAKLFSGINTIDVNITNNIMMGPTTQKLMQNYAGMYSIILPDSK